MVDYPHPRYAAPRNPLGDTGLFELYSKQALEEGSCRGRNASSIGEKCSFSLSLFLSLSRCCKFTQICREREREQTCTKRIIKHVVHMFAGDSGSGDVLPRLA